MNAYDRLTPAQQVRIAEGATLLWDALEDQVRADCYRMGLVFSFAHAVGVVTDLFDCQVIDEITHTDIAAWHSLSLGERVTAVRMALDPALPYLD